MKLYQVISNVSLAFVTFIFVKYLALIAFLLVHAPNSGIALPSFQDNLPFGPTNTPGLLAAFAVFIGLSVRDWGVNADLRKGQT